MRNSLRGNRTGVMRLVRPLAMLLMLGLPLVGTANLTAEGEPELTLRVSDGMTSPTFRAHVGVTYFSAQVKTSAGWMNWQGDLYIGVIPPNNKAAYSWSLEDDIVALAPGLSPIATDIPLNVDATFRPFGPSAHDGLQYSFTGNEPRGMYLVFSLLVKADSDPADSANWIAVDMQPLMRR